jgi:hypothetical protein
MSLRREVGGRVWSRGCRCGVEVTGVVSGVTCECFGMVCCIVKVLIWWAAGVLEKPKVQVC